MLLRCPKCGSRARIIDTITTQYKAELMAIYRCEKCGYSWSDTSFPSSKLKTELKQQLAESEELPPIYKSKFMEIHLRRNILPIMKSVAEKSNKIVVFTYTASSEGQKLLVGDRRVKITIYYAKWIDDIAKSINVKSIKVSGTILHFKLYTFYTKNNMIPFISSANMTVDGLKNNFEFLIRIKSKKIKNEVNTLLSKFVNCELSDIKTKYILLGESLARKIQEMLLSDELVIVSAFLDEYSAKKVAELVENKQKVNLFIPREVDPKTFKAVKLLIPTMRKYGNLSINLIKRLHAKIIMSNTDKVVLTTSNFTRSGLLSELNLGISLTDKNLAKRLAYLLINESKELKHINELVLKETLEGTLQTSESKYEIVFPKIQILTDPFQIRHYEIMAKRKTRRKLEVRRQPRMRTLKIKITSRKSSDINVFCDKIKNKVIKMGGDISGPIPLPTKKLKIRILNRKWFIHRRLIIIKNINERIIKHILKLKKPDSLRIELDYT